MGLLRLLLALSVVINHSGPLFGYSLIGGRAAVQSFFIISGFYMSLIINEKYALQAHAYRLFITNRFLRIFPIYWLVLILTILFSVIIFHPLNLPSHESFLELLIKNVFLFPTTDYIFNNSQTYEGLVVYPAWTLGLELLFYLVAPFIVKRKFPLILFLFLIALFARLYFTHPLRYYDGNYIDRFIPTEAVFFLAGVCSYKWYSYIKRLKIKQRYLFISMGVFIVCTLCYQYIQNALLFVNSDFPRTLEYFYYLLLAVNIPFLFLATTKNRFDKLFGDLSYPVYIVHALVILVCVSAGITLQHNDNVGRIFVLLAVLLSSFFINKFIANPIEHYRQKRLSKKIAYEKVE